MNDLTHGDADGFSGLYEAAFDGTFLKELGILLGDKVPEPAGFLLFTERRGRPGVHVLLERHPASAGLVAEPRGRWERRVGQPWHGQDPGRPRGADAAVAAILARDGQEQTVLELSYPSARGVPLRNMLGALLTSLLPHLGRALRIQALRLAETREGRRASGILDLLPLPTLVLGGDGVVHNLNARALELVGLGETLQIGADEVLHAVDRASDRTLQETLAQIAAQPSDRPRMLSLRNAGSGSRLVLTLKRLLATDRGMMGAGPGGLRPCIELILMIQECAAPLTLSPDALWQTFAMNNKEVDLALSLLNGESIGDLASRRNVSKQTLRNQLTGILRKTETSRQSELVGLLTRLAMSPLH